MCHFLCNKTFIGHISRQQVGRVGGYIPQLWKYGTKSRPAASWMPALCTVHCVLSSVMVCFESSLINFDLATPKYEGHPRSLRFLADSCGSGASAMWQCASLSSTRVACSVGIPCGISSFFPGVYYFRINQNFHLARSFVSMTRRRVPLLVSRSLLALPTHSSL